MDKKILCLWDLQRTDLLLIIGALNNTYQSSLNVLLNIQPFDLLTQFRASRSALRLWKAGGWYFSHFSHARILEIATSRNILDEDDAISDHMSYFFDFNLIDETANESPLVWPCTQTTTAGIFCQNPII